MIRSVQMIKGTVGCCRSSNKTIRCGSSKTIRCGSSAVMGACLSCKIVTRDRADGWYFGRNSQTAHLQSNDRCLNIIRNNVSVCYNDRYFKQPKWHCSRWK